jgi:ABC-2 type transport system permease protein
MIYFRYIRMVMKSMLQYRLSLWLTLIGQFFVSFFAFLGMYLLFERFGTIRGWTFGEVALCFAVVQTSFAITECYARGFDLFSGLIVRGDFDRILLRPRGTILQVFGSSFEVTRIGRLVQSFVVLGLALSWLETRLDVTRILTLVFMVVSGVFIFTGIFMLGATICFFTVQGLEIVNIFTDGGKEIAAYPLSIYNKWVVRFFTFIIPFGSINYLPLMYIVGKAGERDVLYMLTPLFGMLFLVPCVFVWRFGVRHYLSTGS